MLFKSDIRSKHYQCRRRRAPTKRRSPRQNWSTEGVDSNRDASVVITNPDMAAYWAELFDNDGNTMTHPLENPAPPGSGGEG